MKQVTLFDLQEVIKAGPTALEQHITYITNWMREDLRLKPGLVRQGCARRGLARRGVLFKARFGRDGRSVVWLGEAGHGEAWRGTAWCFIQGKARGGKDGPGEVWHGEARHGQAR